MSSEFDVPPESPFALLSAQEKRAWFAYMKLQLRLRYEMNRQLQADSGMSLADFDVLVALTSADEGRMSVSALAMRIGWERSRASHHTKRMATRGLVQMATSQRDRRVTDISLTADGWAAVRDASRGHIDLVRSLFFDGLDTGELEQLSATLERVYDTVIDNGTLPRPADHP